MVKKPLQIEEYKGFTIKYRTMEEYHRKIRKADKRDIKNRIDAWKNEIKKANFCEKCGVDFRILKANGKVRYKHPHHIISEGAVRETYKELIDDLKNGILLCARCHKLSNDSAHEGGFEFTFWLAKNKPEQYNYLKSFLENYKNKPIEILSNSENNASTSL